MTPSLTGSWQLVSSSSSATSMDTRGNIVTRDHNLTRGSLCPNIVTFYADFDPEKQLLYWTLDGIKNTLYRSSHSILIFNVWWSPCKFVRERTSDTSNEWLCSILGLTQIAGPWRPHQCQSQVDCKISHLLPNKCSLVL